jgi:two-component sensor histidine kinase
MSERNDRRPVVEPSLHGETTDVTLRSLEQRIRQQEILAELGVFALRGASLDELLNETVRLTAKGLDIDFCKVLEHHPDKHRFLVRAGTGWGDGVVGVTTVGDDLESPAGYALRTRRPVISNHLEREDRFRTPEILQRFGIRRAMNVILEGEGRPYGVLEVDSRSDDEFEKPDLAFLQGAANLLGMAIERDRHERNLTAALERHRLLLKEMNHRVKNSLAMIGSMLHLQARQADNQALTVQLDQAAHRVNAIAKAHAYLYQGADIEWLDLGKFIESVCKDFDTSLSRCRIHASVDYGIEVPTDDAISAALVVNELIANAAKYAYPSGHGDIWVTIMRRDEVAFSISVRDDGAGLPDGFDPHGTTGLGMRLVNAFAEQSGGTLEWRAAKPGTEFIVFAASRHRRPPA